MSFFCVQAIAAWLAGKKLFYHTRYSQVSKGFDLVKKWVDAQNMTVSGCLDELEKVCQEDPDFETHWNPKQATEKFAIVNLKGNLSPRADSPQSPKDTRARAKVMKVMDFTEYATNKWETYGSESSSVRSGNTEAEAHTAVPRVAGVLAGIAHRVDAGDNHGKATAPRVNEGEYHGKTESPRVNEGENHGKASSPRADSAGDHAKATSPKADGAGELGRAMRIAAREKEGATAPFRTGGTDSKPAQHGTTPSPRASTVISERTASPLRDGTGNEPTFTRRAKGANLLTGKPLQRRARGAEARQTPQGRVAAAKPSSRRESLTDGGSVPSTWPRSQKEEYCSGPSTRLGSPVGSLVGTIGTRPASRGSRTEGSVGNPASRPGSHAERNGDKPLPQRVRGADERRARVAGAQGSKPLAVQDPGGGASVELPARPHMGEVVGDRKAPSQPVVKNAGSKAPASRAQTGEPRREPAPLRAGSTDKPLPHGGVEGKDASPTAVALDVAKGLEGKTALPRGNGAVDRDSKSPPAAPVGERPEKTAEPVRPKPVWPKPARLHALGADGTHGKSVSPDRVTSVAEKSAKPASVRVPAAEGDDRKPSPGRAGGEAKPLERDAKKPPASQRPKELAQSPPAEDAAEDPGARYRLVLPAPTPTLPGAGHSPERTKPTSLRNGERSDQKTPSNGKEAVKSVRPRRQTRSPLKADIKRAQEALRLASLADEGSPYQPEEEASPSPRYRRLRR